MSVTVDANVLIFATNEAEPVHAQARALVERLATGPDIVDIFWPTIMGYLRIVTHPSVLPRPLSPRDAIANVEALRAPPHVRTPARTRGSGTSTSRPEAIPSAATPCPTATSRH